MQTRLMSLILAILCMTSFSAHAQYPQQDTSYSKYFIGSTFFVLGNLVPENKPDFVQLNFGYRVTGKDVISLELKTWKYQFPLGIPFGESFEAPEEKFPGFIREYGFAIAYQRYIWKGLYAGVHVMSAWQSFVDESANTVGRGYQIFNTYRLGYHFKLFNDRFFIQPSVAVTHRPYHTDMPTSFATLDNKWSKFFFGEPGLHFGYNF